MDEKLTQKGKPAMQKSNSGRLGAMVFATGALLFLMIFGTGYGILLARLPDFIARGDMGQAAAWVLRIGGGLLMVLTAIFTAHNAIGFVEIVDRHARRSQPSDPLPPLPSKRKGKLHLVHSQRDTA